MAKAALLSLAEQTVGIARAAGANVADALAIQSADISTSIRHGKPEAIERAESNGIGLRVFVGESSATLSTSDTRPNALKALAEQAVAIARAAPADPFARLADATQLAKNIAAIDLADEASPSIEYLQQLARETEEAGRSISGITNSEGADASASRHHVALATSHGFVGKYETSYYSLSASLIAGSGETMQRDYDYATMRHLNDLPSAESIGINAANRALARLSPRKIPSQQAVVYFEPRVGKQLISAFVGAISGSSITRGTSFLKEAMGEQIFADNLFITDDPLRPRGLSSRPFDAEGIAGVKRDFIAYGKLTSWLLDTRSANQLGLTTTGHASRGLASAPHPSCTNLYLHGGEQTPDELFAALGDGFYVTETIGHGANLLTGDFSVGAGGFWLEGGKKTFPISEVTIAGNLRDMFKSLVAANDLEFRYGVNVPTLAIPQLTIAGS